MPLSKILLTDEEINIALRCSCKDGYGGVAKAQLKKDNGLLLKLLNHYLELANSGDAGFWSPEEEDIVIEVRQSLLDEVKVA